MESVAVKNNQSVYSYNNKKLTRSPKKNTRSFNHNKASENRPPMTTTPYGGLFHNNPPPPSYFSFSDSLLAPQPYQFQYQQQQKPPLLPLPIVPISRNSSLPCGTRNYLSCPTPTPPRTRNTLNNHNSPRKHQKPRTNNSSSKPKSEEVSSVVASTDRLGPEPGVLPKSSVGVGSGAEMYSLLSPPPSSLPLPRFTLRPARSKLSCNAEAAVVDSSASDNLRRILRLP